MVDHWQLLTDDADERAQFASLAATLALPTTAAAPPNRLRHVRRLALPRGVYYLKTFAATQWQNRLRFRCTQPRARDDAERELRVTLALRAAGFGAPRPIAYGRRGAAAFYLCAELPGRALRDWYEAGACERPFVRAMARHCGRLLAAGFALPDLSCEHVFAANCTADVKPAVLDLHNGRLVRPGRAAPSLLQRVLRRCARSVRGVGVPRELALCFALQLLRTAGTDRATRRRLLRTSPPWATATRYEAAGKSDVYADRNPRRAQREAELLAAVWPGRAGESVLDLPCGAGRLLPLLRDRLGHRVVQGDGALAMLRTADERGRATDRVQADVLAMPFADAAGDGVVVFRFLHHLPPDAQRLVVAEACRVAGRFVVVSFFHPCSAHHLQRVLRGWLGASPTRFAVSLGRLAGWFADSGYVLRAHRAEAAYRRDLWLAAFERRPPAGTAVERP